MVLFAAMQPAQPPPLLMERAHAAIQGGQYALAESTLRRAIASAPQDWRVNQWLAEALYFQKKFDQARHFAKTAVMANPKSAHSHALFALCLMKSEKYDEAQKHCELATELDPSNAMNWNSLGILWMMRENFERALAPLEKAHALAPADPLISINYARVVGDHAQVDESFEVLRNVEKSHPLDPDLINLMVARTSYLANFDPAEKLALARRVASLSEGPADRPLPTPLHRIAGVGADRPLRIGLVSHDLRAHSCAYFIRPLLRHLDRSRVSVHCFMTSKTEDAVSRELRGLLREPAETWQNISRREPKQMAEAIAKERIDVLIDIGGYTMGTGVEACVFRPAPLQMTAIGYPGTLGMRSVTHRIVDSITDTRESDAWYSEKLVRLNGCFLCYDPGSDVPAPRAVNSSGDTGSSIAAPIRFGSFNATTKVTQPTLDLWASVLRTVPTGTLTLKGYTLAGEVTPAYLRTQLEKRGIDPARLTCVGRTETGEHHLRYYDNIDIALETVPYNGTTTTCEAMMMGVPVITLAGREHVSRVGASLLTHAGLPELIAHSPEEYVTIASDLANDRARLLKYHASLRDRLLTSALCNGHTYAKHWLDAVCEVWVSLRGT